MAGKTKERMVERGRAKELRKRDGESREGEWGEDEGVKKGGGCERKKEEGDAGEIEEMHTENVGGKESKTRYND